MLFFYDKVERLKAEQSRLDRELDFILSQQEELEELLNPIEAQLNKQQMLQYPQHADVERERTYGLAENIDSQLKQMMQVNKFFTFVLFGELLKFGNSLLISVF